MEDTIDTTHCLTPLELLKLIQDKGPDGYELIDVRSRLEYETRHLPDARHIPVGEIKTRINEIRDDVCTVFYCLKGARSAKAMEMASKVKNPSMLYSLAGGIEAWDGNVVPGFPQSAPFDMGGPIEHILLRAMNFEKGAERLYGALVEVFADSEIRDTLAILHRADEAHAKALYELLPAGSEATSRSFPELYADLKGDMLENGESYDQAIARIESIPPDQRHLLIELGVDMEYRAHELYRTLAAAQPDASVKAVLLSLAEQETQHFCLALGALRQARVEFRRSESLQRMQTILS